MLALGLAHERLEVRRAHARGLLGEHVTALFQRSVNRRGREHGLHRDERHLRLRVAQNGDNVLARGFQFWPERFLRGGEGAAARVRDGDFADLAARGERGEVSVQMRTSRVGENGDGDGHEKLG